MLSVFQLMDSINVTDFFVGLRKDSKLKTLGFQVLTDVFPNLFDNLLVS